MTSTTTRLIRDGKTTAACGGDPSPNVLGYNSTHPQEIGTYQTHVPIPPPWPKFSPRLTPALIPDPVFGTRQYPTPPLRSPISPPTSSPQSSPALTPSPCFSALPLTSPQTACLSDYALSSFHPNSFLTNTFKRNLQPLEYPSGQNKRPYLSFLSASLNNCSLKAETLPVTHPLGLAPATMADCGNFNDDKYSHLYASETQSEPHTPIDQIPAPGSNVYENPARFGSVSSIATTDDDDAMNETQYTWTLQQDQLIRTAYDEYTKLPQTTPFSGRYVPSGAVNRVAKNTFKLAKKHQVHFPHSINAVRHRIGMLYNLEPENFEELRQISAPDYFSMLPYDHTNGESRLPRDLTGNPDDFNFFDNNSALRQLSVEEKYAHKLTPAGWGEPPLRGKHLEPSLVTRKGTNANNIGVPNHSDLAINRSPNNRSPNNRSPNNRSPNNRSPKSRSPMSRSPTNNSPKSWGGSNVMPVSMLAAPFKEPRPQILPPANNAPANQTVEEEVINIVAKRKRDSLRMKRGQM